MDYASLGGPTMYLLVMTVAEFRLCHPRMYPLCVMPKLSTQTTSTHWPKPEMSY